MAKQQQGHPRHAAHHAVGVEPAQRATQVFISELDERLVAATAALPQESSKERQLQRIEVGHGPWAMVAPGTTASLGSCGGCVTSKMKNGTQAGLPSPANARRK
jgi:hypothetical protein